MPGSAASDFFADPAVQTVRTPVTHRTGRGNIAVVSVVDWLSLD
jgi:hypothetical protein